MISILILTKNEEQSLPGCLASVTWSDDIVVFDSDSVDKTISIARSASARVVTRPVDSRSPFGGDEAHHKNWGLRNIEFKYEWVLHLDADERTTPELVQSVFRAIQNPGQNVAFRIRRRDFFLGRWLKHVQVTPFYIRLFRPEKMKYERLVNPVSLPQGPVGELEGYIDHFPFSKGVQHWTERHNAYSTLEAQQIAYERAVCRQFSPVQAIFGLDANQRRMHQKGIFYHLPARPALKFLLLYFLKGGFLDGEAGFTYAMLQSFYEYMIVLKTREFAHTTQTSGQELGTLKDLKNATPL